jgi:predicted GIY-YIG superfamily endonuclease
MASARNGTLYIGVTSNLPARAAQHRENRTPGFTSKHRCHTLVYSEPHPDMPTAIAREKQLKSGSRHKKCALIEATNPTWRDLYPDIL